MALPGGGHAYVGVRGRRRGLTLAGASCDFDGTNAANAARGHVPDAGSAFFSTATPAAGMQRLASRYEGRGQVLTVSRIAVRW
jgi:hypothetical protein